MLGSRARRTGVAVITSVLGLALLAWQIQKAEPAKIKAGLLAIGIAGFLVILGLAIVRFTARALAWKTFIGEGVTLPDAVTATLAGDALGNVTPLGLLVSEPTKAIYLRSRVPASRALAALTAETAFYTISVGMVIMLGTISMLAMFALPDYVRWSGIVLLGLTVTALVAVLWIIWRQPPVASAILSRVPFVSVDALVNRVREFETTTYAFVRQRPDRLAIVIACDVAFHAVSFAEAYLTLWLISRQSLPLEAFILDTLNRIVNVVFKMVPFKVGVDEVSAAWLARLLGLDPFVGVTMALVRKVRLLVWAAVGMGLLATRAGGRQGQRARETN